MSPISKHKSGFTLAEILIVITILTILGLTALIGINPLMQILRGYDTRRKGDLAQIKIAFEAYYADHDCYPPANVLKNCASQDLAPYLSTIPCDPSSHEPYQFYISPSDNPVCPQKVAVYAKLANVFDPKGDTIKFCPDTIADSFGDISYLDTVAGCSNRVYCQDWYGCKNGACVVVAVDKFPTCSPSTNCDNRCGAPNSQTPDEFCSQKSRRGKFTNECQEI